MYTIPRIDYATLAKSQEYYEVFKFERVEVPWLTSGTANGVTMPKDKNPFMVSVHHKFLVGSAETGFVEMMLNNAIQPGKYQAVTPCFRDDGIDKYHCPYFMKNELIIIEPDDQVESLNWMIERAFSFFSMYVKRDNMRLVESSPGIMDIEAYGVELGSYGIRHFNGHTWVFGTGCALPRLSQVKHQYEIAH